MAKRARAQARMVCHCLHCGHEWKARGAERPTRCPKCITSNWDRPALPDVNLGEALENVSINFRVEELRYLITLFEVRIQELLGQKRGVSDGLE